MSTQIGSSWAELLFSPVLPSACKFNPCPNCHETSLVPVLRNLQAKPSHLLKPLALRKLPGRYLAHQEGLPTLPVPPLQQTMERYLSVLEPIISEEELSHTRELVEDFRKPGGVGERLQKGLERRAKKRENWVGSGPGGGQEKGAWPRCMMGLQCGQVVLSQPVGGEGRPV